LVEDGSLFKLSETVMRRSRYTVIPLLLLIIVIFVASQLRDVHFADGVQVSASSAGRDAK
jgi:hypothetical protein